MRFLNTPNMGVCQEKKGNQAVFLRRRYGTSFAGSGPTKDHANYVARPLVPVLRWELGTDPACALTLMSLGHELVHLLVPPSQGLGQELEGHPEAHAQAKDYANQEGHGCRHVAHEGRASTPGVHHQEVKDHRAES